MRYIYDRVPEPAPVAPALLTGVLAIEAGMIFGAVLAYLL